MYYYYAVRTAFGHTPWWKRYLTVFQMVQFWLNMLGLAAFAALRLSGTACTGDWYSWGASLTINASFYMLFQLFYNKTYAKKDKTQ